MNLNLFEQALLHFTACLSRTTQKRGLHYFKSGFVENINFLDEQEISATVLGSYANSYSVTLLVNLGSDQLRGTCSCPVGIDCKHSYALALAARELLRDQTGEPSTNSEIELVENKLTPATDAESILKSEVLRRVGKPRLRRIEANYISRISRIWKSYQRFHNVLQRDLEDLAATGYYRSNHGERAENFYLLTEEVVKDPIEFFDLLLFCMVLEDWEVPESLFNSSTFESIEGIFKQKMHDQRITQWKSVLHDYTLHPRLKGFKYDKGSLDIRLVLAGKKWHFEINPENQWKKLTPALSKQLQLTSLSEGLSALTPEAGQFYLPFLEIESSRNYFNRYDKYEAKKTALNRLIRNPISEGRVVDQDRNPVQYMLQSLNYSIELQSTKEGKYARLYLVDPDGNPLGHSSILLPADEERGIPSAVIEADKVFDLPLTIRDNTDDLPPEILVPWEALKSSEGLGFLKASGSPLPKEIEDSVQEVILKPLLRLELTQEDNYNYAFEVKLEAQTQEGEQVSVLQNTAWLDTPLAFSKETIPLLDWDHVLEAQRHYETFHIQWYDYKNKSIIEIGKSGLDKLSNWLCAFPKHTTLQVPAKFSSLIEPSKKAVYQLSIEHEPSKRDWFNVSATLCTEDIELTQEEIKLLTKANGRFVFLKGKGLQRLEIDSDSETQNLIKQLGVEINTHSPQQYHTLQLNHWSDEIAETNPPGWDDCLKRIQSVNTPKMPPVPQEVDALLRPYQREGFQFLCHLSNWGLGGILADDMGLGKTLQALAWLLWLKSLGKKKSPFKVLVVCPKSVMDNWLHEPVKFNTGLSSQVFKKGMEPSDLATSDILITNYAQLRLNADLLTGIEWNAVILDEGQYIKNPTSKTAQTAFELKSNHRIVLTGTPVENRLLDLWSILRFAMPGLLGSQASFQRMNNEKKNPHAAANVARRIKPFLLRRSKLQVAKDLPPRTEEEIYCKLEGKQKQLYTVELKLARQALLQVKSQQQFNKERFNILQSLMRMRQICCDSRLVDPGTSSNTRSAKMEALFDILQPILEEGNKVLVFSQFVSQLTLIEKALTQKDIPYLLLTGKTENRGALIKRFQKPDTEQVFLLSLKAAGSGLNLTAASYVVLFDPWWNPAVEAQAIDRTHRIGQTNQVIAYRLIAKDTIEEKIRALQLEKAQLADTVVQEESLANILNLDKLRQLLNE